MSIQMQAVESSQIKAIGYDAESKTLAIEFKGGGEYRYANVEPELYQDMMASPSVGSFFYKNIKANKEKYPYSSEGATCGDRGDAPFSARSICGGHNTGRTRGSGYSS